MEKRYKLVFDDIILKQLKKAGKNKQIKDILTKIFDKIEELGPDAGNLIDSRLFIYEIKLKRPPIRLYYKHKMLTDEIYVFEYEMKTSEEKQQKTIDRIRKKLSES
ncbi:MAG: hypothetical protein AABY07_07435 [Nanoarchaeota archaeon]